MVISSYHTLNVLGHLPQVIVAFGSLFLPLFISFIVTELQLGGVINLLMSPCKVKQQKTSEACLCPFRTSLFILHYTSSFTLKPDPALLLCADCSDWNTTAWISLKYNMQKHFHLRRHHSHLLTGIITLLNISQNKHYISLQ